MRIAVTGATGSLGGRVVRLLAEQAAAEVVALTRRPAVFPPGVITRIAEYADPGALRSGLAEVDTLVFISSDGEGTRVLAHHLNVVSAARASGVAHIVALSSVDADVTSPFCYAVTNGLTEQAIRDGGGGFSIVRASIFAEFFRQFLRPARTTGEVTLPTENGRIGLVSKSDVAGCLAALASSGPTARYHEVTGPEALDTAAIAALAAEAWGRSVNHRPLSSAAYLAQLAVREEPWWAYAYTSMFASIREQRWDRVTTEVQQLTGRPPRPFSEILR